MRYFERSPAVQFTLKWQAIALYTRIEADRTILRQAHARTRRISSKNHSRHLCVVQEGARRSLPSCKNLQQPTRREFGILAWQQPPKCNTIKLPQNFVPALDRRRYEKESSTRPIRPRKRQPSRELKEICNRFVNGQRVAVWRGCVPLVPRRVLFQCISSNLSQSSPSSLMECNASAVLH